MMAYCPRFKTAKDEEGKKESGLSPLIMAAMSGNVQVAHALVAEHKADVHVRLRDADTVTGSDAGGTPLHACMAFAAGHENILGFLELFLNAGVDINAQAKSGM